MNVKKCSISLVAAVALSAVYGVRAEIIVPETPVNLATHSGTKGVASANMKQGEGLLFNGARDRWLGNAPNAKTQTYPSEQIHFYNAAPVVNAYTIYAGKAYDNGKDGPGRAPNSWTIYGAKDPSSEWVELHSVSGNATLFNDDAQVYVFTNAAAYSCYKFVCTACNGGDYVAIDDIQLHHFAHTDMLEIQASGFAGGTPSPAYGYTNGLEVGASLTLNMPERRVVDQAGKRVYTLAGFTLTDNDGNVLHDGTVDELPYEYTHDGSFVRLTWKWESAMDRLIAESCDSHDDDLTVPSKTGVNEISANPGITYHTSGNASSLGPHKLFNNGGYSGTSNRFFPNFPSGGSIWAQYRFLKDGMDDPKIVTGFRIFCDDSSRYPSAFTLSGSNTGADGDWHPLLSVNSSFYGDFETPNAATYPYFIDNETPYSYYRFEVTKCTGGLLQVNQLEFFSYKCDDLLEIKGEPGLYGIPEPDYGPVTGLEPGETLLCLAPSETIAVGDGIRSACVGYAVSQNGGAPVTNLATRANYVHSGKAGVLTWLWANEYRQTVAVKGAGKVSVDEVWAADGETVVITATPTSADSPFQSWLGDVPEGQAANPTLTYAADRPRNLTAVFAAPVHVAVGGDDSNDGSSWDAAVGSLARAMELSASGGKILVGEGTFPVAGGVLTLSAGVKLIGLGPDKTVVAGDPDAPGPLLVCENELAEVNGIAFTGGTASDGYAGGLRLSAGLVTNCVFDSCASTVANALGGGVYMEGTGRFVDCTVTNCTSAGVAGGVVLRGGTVSLCRLVANRAATQAGGIQIGGTGTIACDHCFIAGNSTSAGAGGGVYLSGELTLSDCQITNNVAVKGDGGGVLMSNGASLLRCDISGNRASAGGGVYAAVCESATDCRIAGNTAGEGGGVYVPSSDKGSLSMTRCRVVDNTATGSYGGGLYYSKGMMLNCLVADNLGKTGGGIFVQGGTYRNCTIAGNRGSSGAGVSMRSSGTFQNSIVAGNFDRTTGVETNCVGHASVYGSNTCLNDPDFVKATFLVADPLFVDAANGDYTLKLGSPCVNGGAMLDYTAESLDLAHQPRIFNFGKRSSKPDMGCYESPYGTPGMLLLLR